MFDRYYCITLIQTYYKRTIRHYFSASYPQPSRLLNALCNSNKNPRFRPWSAIIKFRQAPGSILNPWQQFTSPKHDFFPTLYFLQYSNRYNARIKDFHDTFNRKLLAFFCTEGVEPWNTCVRKAAKPVIISVWIVLLMHVFVSVKIVCGHVFM